MQTPSDTSANERCQRMEQRRPISFTQPITPFYPASCIVPSRQFRSIAEWIRDFTGGSVETHVRDWCEAAKERDYPRITPLVHGGSNIFRLTRTFDCLWRGRETRAKGKKSWVGFGFVGETGRATTSEIQRANVRCRCRVVLDPPALPAQLSSLFDPLSFRLLEYTVLAVPDAVLLVAPLLFLLFSKSSWLFILAKHFSTKPTKTKKLLSRWLPRLPFWVSPGSVSFPCSQLSLGSC